MRFRWLTALALLLSLSCGDDGGGPAEPAEPGKVTLESARAASKKIGMSGGTLAATASDGTKYTLVVPEGALARPTTITMTPVADIEGFPVLDGVTAGVDFRPSGLVFATPARLTIESPAAAGAGELPIAVNYEGDADEFTVGFAVETGDKITVLVQHFSGFGMDFGTEEDMGALLNGLTATSQSQVFANELLLLVSVTPDDGAAQEDLMRRWFEEVILPGIEAAANDGELLTALGDFNFWRTEVPTVLGLFLNVEVSLAGEIDAARDAFIPKLQAAVTANNDLCKQTHSLDALRNVVFWQRQAGALSIDTPANGLDEATVRGNLCARLVLEGASLPANMQAGFPHSLDFRLLMQFTDGTTQDVACAVSITATNADVQNPTGNTDPFGNYTTVITATSNDAVEVDITGHVILPGETIPTLISETFVVSSTGSNLAGSYMGTLDLAGAALDPVVHTATIAQNQNAVSGTFEARDFSGSFTATLSGQDLIGVDLTINGSEITVNEAHVIPNGATTAVTFNLTGTTTVNSTPVGVQGLTVSGPDCRWENLVVSAPLEGAFAQVRSPGGQVTTVALSGSATLTSSSFSATFSGPGASGIASGPITKPGQGTGCTFMGIDNGAVQVCGLGKSGDYCVGTFAGRWVVVIGNNFTCADGTEVLETRLSFGTGAGLGAFCN